MTVHFIGAGPGRRRPDHRARAAADRGRAGLPVRGQPGAGRAAGRLPARARGWSTPRDLTLDEIIAELVAAHAAGQDVARLHSGDPSVFSAMAEQMRRLDAAGVPYDVSPGVPAFAAAAASLGRELTVPGVGADGDPDPDRRARPRRCRRARTWPRSARAGPRWCCTWPCSASTRWSRSWSPHYGAGLPGRRGGPGQPARRADPARHAGRHRRPGARGRRQAHRGDRRRARPDRRRSSRTATCTPADRCRLRVLDPRRHRRGARPGRRVRRAARGVDGQFAGRAGRAPIAARRRGADRRVRRRRRAGRLAGAASGSTRSSTPRIRSPRDHLGTPRRRPRATGVPLLRAAPARLDRAAGRRLAPGAVPGRRGRRSCPARPRGSSSPPAGRSLAAFAGLDDCWFLVRSVEPPGAADAAAPRGAARPRPVHRRRASWRCSPSTGSTSWSPRTAAARPPSSTRPASWAPGRVVDRPPAPDVETGRHGGGRDRWLTAGGRSGPAVRIAPRRVDEHRAVAADRRCGCGGADDQQAAHVDRRRVEVAERGHPDRLLPGRRRRGRPPPGCPGRGAPAAAPGPRPAARVRVFEAGL